MFLSFGSKPDRNYCWTLDAGSIKSCIYFLRYFSTFSVLHIPRKESNLKNLLNLAEKAFAGYETTVGT